MRTKEITITSKNQITLPAEYVRNLKLEKSRRLTVRRRGDEIILKPEATLEERMKPIWDEVAKHRRGKRSLNDRELKQAIRESVVSAWEKKERRHGR